MKIDKAKIENELRRLPVNKLRTLSSVLNREESPVLLNSALISGATGARAEQLGGQVSSVARTTVGENPLFYPVGKIEPYGSMTWRLNEEVFPKDELKKLVDSILKDIQKWQQKISR